MEKSAKGKGMNREDALKVQVGQWLKMHPGFGEKFRPEVQVEFVLPDAKSQTNIMFEVRDKKGVIHALDAGWFEK